MNIYPQPYTYSVYCIPTKQIYYGVQYGRNAHPSNIGTKYLTSSEIVKRLIQQYGKDNFVFKVRKTFTCPRAAIIHEQKMIYKLSKKYGKELFLNYNRIHPHRSKPKSIVDEIQSLKADLFDLAIKINFLYYK
jgi:hypothetical protein